MTLYATAARANGGEPDAGRRLLSWAQQAGFDDITPTGSLWCFATPETRDWWGGMWADRIVESALARQLIESELATPAELDEISSAWRDWAAAPDGWLSIPARRDHLPRSSAFALVRRAVLAFSFLASTLSEIDNDTLEDPCVSE